MITRTLQPYVRRIVYTLALLWALGLYEYLTRTIPEINAALASLLRFSALSSLFFLFATLVPGLIRGLAPQWPGNGLLITARQALGITAFAFALVHASLGFFHSLGGSFKTLWLIPRTYQLAIVASSFALLILSTLALTSLPYFVRRLAKNWKIIHRLIYLALPLVIFHAFLIGSHFTDPKSPASVTVIMAGMIYTAFSVTATARRLSLTDSTRPDWLNQCYYFGLALLLVAAGYLSFQAFHKGAQHREFPRVSELRTETK